MSDPTNPFLPRHLVGYTFISELQGWASREGAGATNRWWVLTSGPASDVCGIDCSLRWHAGGQSHSLSHWSKSAEESVWGALQRFAIWAERAAQPLSVEDSSGANVGPESAG